MASIEKKTTASGEARYRVRWRVGGKFHEEWLPTLQAAKSLRLSIERDAQDGVLVDRKAGTVTLSDYFDRWLASRLVKGRPLTPATRLGYRRLWDRNIAERIGGRQLRTLRPDTIREWHGKVATDASHDQAAKSYRLLRAVLATAEADELIRQNPCRIRGGGEENAGERPMVATSLVFELADAMPVTYRPLVLLAGFAGLRTGESLGLRRRDVDVLHREVRVVQQAQEITGAGRIVVPPKTDAGKRAVALPSIVVTALEEHLAERVDADADAPLFTGPEGGPLRRASLSKAWQAAVKKTGAPKGLRLHDLRHHAATLTARMPGVTTKELMARIGHVSPRAALRYQHATAERDQAIASYLDDVVAAARKEDRAPVVGLRGAEVGLAP